MDYFDLHCDTAGECFCRNLPLTSDKLHFKLCKGGKLDRWVQIFAIWISDDLRGKEALEHFEKVLFNFKKEVEANDDKIKLCQHISDVENAFKEKKCAALTSCEGGSPFACEYGISLAKELGVKLITLTWDGENELGFGCQSGSDLGLKPVGKLLLKQMQKNNIAVDVSHLNRAGFFDAVSSGAKVIATHSNSEAVLLKRRRESLDRAFSCRRSLNDEQIKILIDAGGLIGINFYKSYLGDKGDDGFEAVFEHMEHIFELGGENVLAVGSDFDGCDIGAQLCSTEKIPALYAYLLQKGMSERLLKKIFFANSYNFFKIILQS